MKKYEKPEISIKKFTVEDILSMSSANIDGGSAEFPGSWINTSIDGGNTEFIEEWFPL